MKIYLTAAWILRGYLSCLFYDYFLPSMLAARRAKATVCLVITGARAELAGGERGGEDQRFPVRIVRWLLLPPSITTFLITGMVTSQRKFSISKVFSSFQKKTLCRCSPYMVFD